MCRFKGRLARSRSACTAVSVDSEARKQCIHRRFPSLLPSFPLFLFFSMFTARPLALSSHLGVRLAKRRQQCRSLIVLQAVTHVPQWYSLVRCHVGNLSCRIRRRRRSSIIIINFFSTGTRWRRRRRRLAPEDGTRHRRRRGLNFLPTGSRRR